MIKSCPEKVEQDIAQALLKLAPTRPWRAITLHEIAQETPYSTTEVKVFFQSPAAMAPTIVRYVDDCVEKTIDTTHLPHNPQERLFDVFMARFDVLQNHRPAIIALAQASRQFPDLAAQILQAHWHTIGQILALTKLERQGPALFLQKTGLLAVFHFTYQRWEKDESQDLTKTMAALNRALHKFSHVFSDRKR